MEMVHNLRFPGRISKSKDKEIFFFFYKILHREYRLRTKERESNQC